MKIFLLAAAKPTVWEKLRAVPLATWGSVLVVILVLWMLMRFWKSLRDINEFAPWLVFVLVGGSVIFYWAMERNEPPFLTPVIDMVADVLPFSTKPPSQPNFGQ